MRTKSKTIRGPRCNPQVSYGGKGPMLLLFLSLFVCITVETPAQRPRSTPSRTIDSAAPSTPQPSPVPPSVSMPESSWWTNLTDETPGVLVLVVGLGISVFALLHLPNLMRFVGRRPGRFRRPSTELRKMQRSPLDMLGDVIGKPIGKKEGVPIASRVIRDPTSRPAVYAVEQPRVNQKPLNQTATKGPYQLGDLVKIPPMANTSSPNKNGQRLQQPGDDLLRPEIMQFQERGREERARLMANEITITEMHRTLEQMQQRIRELENGVVNHTSMSNEQDSELNNQVRQVAEVHAELNHQISLVTAERAMAKQHVASLLQEMGQIEMRIQARFSEFQTALDRQTVPDSFFNKTLGAVLGQNLETLQEGNFERLIGEKLNQFFQTGVEHGERLQELHARAQRINAALKDVSIQMERLNAQASVAARLHLQRVEAFVNELSGLLSQMQDRRATIETLLRVPVSMHAGARRTFLDELGRGIRREINKLNDPESYFRSELKNLITTDLLAVVNICDKTVASPPGTRPELESSLKQLFEQAGLRPILPRQGDAFKMADQELIEVARGGGGGNLTVAHVITRGFYYKDRDRETLLRKAGVMVYR